MTREGKAKAYDEVVARINKAVNEGLVSENFGRDMLGIAESDDERIRHALIEFLREAYSKGIAPEECAKWVVWLDKPKEQKPALIAENDNWYICIKDFYAGGKKWASVGDLVQAKNGMYMMGRDDISEWFRRAYYDEIKPAEWSEEDETAFGDLMWCIEQARKSAKDENDMGNIWFAENWLKNRLKSIRPQSHWKPSEEQIEALEDLMRWGVYLSVYPKIEKQIESLYEDLKKL